MIGSPSPSHPTVRSVFPSTAVRQSSSHTMRRFRRVLEHAAANVGEPHGIQLAVRKAFPSETPAFASLGQVPAKTDVDKALEPSEGLAGVRVPEVVDPPRPNPAKTSFPPVCTYADLTNRRREAVERRFDRLQPFV